MGCLPTFVDAVPSEGLALPKCHFIMRLLSTAGPHVSDEPHQGNWILVCVCVCTHIQQRSHIYRQIKINVPVCRCYRRTGQREIKTPAECSGSANRKAEVELVRQRQVGQLWKRKKSQNSHFVCSDFKICQSCCCYYELCLCDFDCTPILWADRELGTDVKR